MPPYQPGAGLGEASGSNRRQAEYAEPRTSVSRPRFGRRPAEAVPPPLPPRRDADRQQPWPLPAQSDPPAEPIRIDATDPGQEPEQQQEKLHPRGNGARRYSAIGYTTVGFMAGAVFWHAVGFWSFVHEAVFSGPRSEAHAQPSAPAAPPPRAVAFDEEKLRDHAVRSTTTQAWQQPQKITTGSIPSAAPSQSEVLQPQVMPAAASDAAQPERPLVTGPGETSWQPAVSRAPRSE